MCRTVLPTKQNYTLSSFASWLTANPGIITLLPGPFVKGCVCVCGGVSVCVKAIVAAVRLSPEAQS